MCLKLILYVFHKHNTVMICKGKKSKSSFEPEHCFWEGELYSKSYFRNIKNKTFRYFDNSSIFKYVFFHWFTKWMRFASKNIIKPYDLHPLPVRDQILKYLPVISKHIGDGLIRLELYEKAKSESKGARVKRPYRSILLRALIKTIWKRALISAVGLILVNVLSMSIAILVKKLLEVLNNKTLSFNKIFLFLMAVVGSQTADGLLFEISRMDIIRLNTIIHYLISCGVFNQSQSHRRKFVNNVNGSNALNVCSQVLHSFAPDSECSKNPLLCEARRWKNRPVNPVVFSFEIMDAYYISMASEGLKYVIDFSSNFTYGVFLLSLQVKANLWVLYVLAAVILIVMIVLEIVVSYLIMILFKIRDLKFKKLNDIFYNLPIIRKMLYDDVAINIIAKNRNNELSVFFVCMFLSFFNMTLCTACINLSFYLIKLHFVRSVNNASVITDIDTAGFMSTFYILMRILNSMFLVPLSFKLFGMAGVSVKRLEEYMKESPPNFYIKDNIYTGSVKTSSNVVETSNQIPKNAVVFYEDATFSWVNTRKDLLNKNYEPFLKNINFELKRGEMAIITGDKGAGKSNFIKSMLGEMTLVGGSMAVVPLHTSMPIFYASQDIWLQQGTVRSNIAFGHKFDENLYNQVLKAVELEFDISTWEKGDMRVLSDNAPSLSGGQRVRMEMARAVYAYLVFHKVNQEYNDSKCSFLMCLDSSFHGLDPYVSKTIFNNLFNLKTGLLIKDDLSIVLTSSKTTLDTCSKLCDLSMFSNCPIYTIIGKRLILYSKLHDFIKFRRVNYKDYQYLSSNKGPYHMSFLSNDMLSICSSGSTSRVGRREVTKAAYSKSFKTFVQDELAGVKYNPYSTYIKPAVAIFVFFIILTISYSALDNAKFVFASNLSDFISTKIKDHKNGFFVDFESVKSRCNIALFISTLLIISIILLSLMSALFMTMGCTISSRKLHEYFLDSIFSYSSFVIKIKKQINELITYLSCDICIIDDSIGIYMSLFLISSIQFLMSTATVFYLIPISIPILLLTLILLFNFILLKLIRASKNVFLIFLEACSQVNRVCEVAISGSSIQRSFKKDLGLSTIFTEHRDYKSRGKFVMIFIKTWSAIVFNCSFSSATLLVLIIPIILDKFTKYKLKVGYFGLALSLSMNVLKSFNKFSNNFSKLEISMCSMQRFRYFIPRNKKLKFSKCLNTHQEYIVNMGNDGKTDFDLNRLLKRRAMEFKADESKFYGLRKLFFRPKISILDVGQYLSPEHSGVELKDVCVYTTVDHTPESMILKHVNVSAHRSEIIGMVGRTGAGKTTLLSVIQNVISNRTGQVLLDGKELKEIPKIVLRQIIGVLPQLPFVFKGWTIRRFLDPRKLFTDDDINKALIRCGLLGFVNGLQGGKKLDTVIIAEDIKLSGKRYGKSKPISYKNPSVAVEFNIKDYESHMVISYTQLRTLWLARLVLYRHFYRMIIVDEPPEENLIDETTAKNDDLGVPIYELLQKYFSHCTTFVTAHDVSVLKNCTSVWVVHNGCLIRTCKVADLSENESIAKIIEESLMLT